MAINVGDLVRITTLGYSYPQWQEQYNIMGFRNDEERVNPYVVGDVLKVFAIDAHPISSSGMTLYGLEHPTNSLSTQILLDNRAVEYLFPGNWHIKITEENNEMLGNWRDSGSIDGLEGIVLSEYHGSRGYWLPDNGRIPDHCQIEITTEQFVQYVLNQPTTNMPQTTTPEQVYQNAMNALNLQPGDTVRVTQSLPSYSQGWNNAWATEMDNYIGNEYEVRRVNERLGVAFKDCPFNFPIYSLELVRRANEVLPTQEPTTNLENEQEDAVVTTTDKVICITDKWNYVNLGEVYDVVKRDEYYTYVKDSVGGESRYAHHYFEDWVDADTKARRDSFKALFGDHSMPMFKSASDDVQKLMSELYPKLYEYKGWIKLKKETNHDSHYVFEGVGMRLISENDTTNERLHGTLRFDPDHISHEVIYNNGYAYLRFRHNR